MFNNRCSDNDDVCKRDVPSFIEPRPPLIQNPFMRPRPEKGTNLLDLFEDSEFEEPELVQVYLRLKPCKVPNTLYEVRSEKCLVTSLDTATAGHGRRTQHNVSKMYTFSKIFGPQCNQKEIFEEVVKDNLKRLPDGHSFTLLTYGASGSGKTYTLMGTVGSPGLVPRSLEFVFKLVDASQLPSYKPAENGAEKLNLLDQDYELKWVKRLRHVSAPLRDKYRRMSVQLNADLAISSSDLYNRDKHYLWVSFVEIYNEAIYDLLAPPEKRTKLRIREDSSGHVYVKGAMQAFVRSGEEAYDVMVAGRHNLVVAATGVHAQSSRSHCIFTITMLTETEGGIRTSCVRLCDLAGCERARATRNTGARMQESRAINSSLHVLERCLHMLRQKQRNRNDALVPYRESKLTRLLGTGLSGARGEAVSIVVTLNPSPEYAHETKHVLSLAAVAQDIQINNTTALITSLEQSSAQETTINCSADVLKLRADNELLHFELVQAQARNKELLAAMEEKQQVAADTMRELVEEAKDLTRQYYQAQLDALRAQMDDMIQEYESKLAAMAKQAPPPETGTPSRYLQSKVTQLMTEIAVLEEQLTVERLARVRVEKEMQHLRTCIEERDEKGFTDASPSPDVIDLSESEYESDEETTDPINESLEPIFKKDINRSILKQNDTISIHTIDNIKEDNEFSDSENVTMESKNSETSIEDGEQKNNSTINNNMHNSINITQEAEEKHPLSIEYGDNENGNRNTLDTYDKNKTAEPINTTYHKMNDENDSGIDNFVCRGTYFVCDRNSNNDMPKEKNINLLRGTYFVSDTDSDMSLKNKESCDKDVTYEVVKESVIVKPIIKITDTDNSMMKSIKAAQDNDNSLTQFEQLEKAAKNDECEIAQNQSVFGDINMLKGKRTYFYNESNNSPDENASNTFMNKEKRIYFDNIDINVETFNMTTSYKKDTKKEQYPCIVKNNELDVEKEQSPTIVKNNELGDDPECITIKKLLRDSFTKPEIITSVKKNRLAKKQASVDLFESPILVTPKKHIEIAKSNDQLILEASTNNHLFELKQSKETLPTLTCDILQLQQTRNMNKPSVGQASTEALQMIIDCNDHVGKDVSPENAVESYIKKDITQNIVRQDILKLPMKILPSEELKTTTESINNLVQRNDVDNLAFEKHADEFYPKKDINNIHKSDMKKESVEELKTLINVNDNIIEKESDKHLRLHIPKLSNKKQESELTVKRDIIDTLFNKNNVETPMTIKSPKQDSGSLEKPCMVLWPRKEGIAKSPVNNEIDKSIEASNEMKKHRKLESTPSVEMEISIKKEIKLETASLIEASNQTSDNQSTNIDNTIEEYEKIYKDISHSRTTEFELLAAECMNDNTMKNYNKETKYNLRNKDTKTNILKADKSKVDNEEVLLESVAKSECKSKQRSLRLRRRKNQEQDDLSNKLKDIVNLQTEFSDVTMDVPAPLKISQDIPSPEKNVEENMPPSFGTQSCPAKSCTRSRRKLFTPRVEPLEESLSQTGDSNERIYVPRPSYHRPRARRKL